MRYLRVLLAVPVLFGAISLSGCGKDSAPAPYTVDLEVWGLFDDSSAYQEALAAFRDLNKDHIGNVTYRKMSEATYQEDIVRAFAEGKGPDIFLIRNSWLPKFETLIAPAPAYQFSEKEYRDAFADVVAHDFVVEGKTYGAPLSIDSLALYYNKDLFNAAGIANPPSTWDEFLINSKALSSVDTFGNIVQSGAAFGTAKNINRSPDILLALGLQRGAIVESKGTADTLQITGDPMGQAFDFYSQFSKIGSESYSWNSRQHYSIDAFYEGSLAMMVNYSWHIDTIRRKNAKLNFAVAALPQFSGFQPSNYANYWSFVVAKNKVPPVVAEGQPALFPVERYNDLRVHESWQLLHYLTFPHPEKSITLRNPLSNTSAVLPVEDDPAKTYLEKTRKPAARRDLIEEQKRDPLLAPFASGNLLAKSWRIGEIERAEGVIAESIESVDRGENTVRGALQSADAQVRAIIERK